MFFYNCGDEGKPTCSQNFCRDFLVTTSFVFFTEIFPEFYVIRRSRIRKSFRVEAAEIYHSNKIMKEPCMTEQLEVYRLSLCGNFLANLHGKTRNRFAVLAHVKRDAKFIYNGGYFLVGHDFVVSVISRVNSSTYRK